MLNVSWPVVEIRTLCIGEGETIFDLSRIISESHQTWAWM